jgi:retrograde regulation protein 2
MATPHFHKDDPSQLHALVDMGSNGIRFSITTLAPPTARITPTLYQSRAGISLYDAQYPASSNGVRQPVDSHTIEAVVSAYRSFKRTCADFGNKDGYQRGGSHAEHPRSGWMGSDAFG